MANLHGLIHNVKLFKAADHSAAGTSDVTSAAIDTQGYHGVLVFTSFGTAASGNLLRAQQSEDDGGSDAYSDLEGTSVTSGSSDEDVWIDIYDPRKRYVKVVATRGTSSTLESIWVMLYNPHRSPPDNTTTGTITGEAFNGPDEGTA